MLRHKLTQLEHLVRHRPGPAVEPVITMTAAESAVALRNILRAVQRRLRQPIDDPFPALDAEAFVLAFWPWLLEHGAPWPPWGQAAALRIAGSCLRAAGLIAADGQFTRRGRQAWALLSGPPLTNDVPPDDRADEISPDVDW